MAIKNAPSVTILPFCSIIEKNLAKQFLTGLAVAAQHIYRLSSHVDINKLSDFVAENHAFGGYEQSFMIRVSLEGIMQAMC